MARPLPLAEKVYDPDNDLTHYVADALSGNVTLCGQTDWIGGAPGKPTDAPVDCRACISIVRYVQGSTFDALEPLRNGKN